jgi:molecular chaperone HtpG
LKPFKAESKRLLELMINSIYTHKEIFLRELISNASDALDKLYYRSLTDENVSFAREDFYIRLEADKDARTLKVIDTGVGMSQKEMEENLGVIAHSGSLQFKAEAESRDGVEIIGQFGVGFYSSFMAADAVTVRSRAFGAAEAWEWSSKGAEGYTIAPCDKADVGTEVLLHLKADTEDESFGDYLEDYRLRALVKKYSDFIKYPIKLGDETLNSMVPIWRKNRSELRDEDYERFYMDKHFGFEKPLRHMHVTAEGATSYTALLYIPGRAPYDYYTKEFQKGLELYANGVLIMEKCADLLPDYFGFAQGLVDSADLSLNISRELLQHDRQLKVIAKRVKEKVKAELLNLLENDRAAYEGFFAQFGRALKYGVYADWGAHKEDLQDLLLFYSSTEQKPVSLKEYVSRMPEGQTAIYYATGDSAERMDKLPQTESLREQGTEILYFTDDVDEFAIRVLQTYGEKEFQSVQSGDVDAGEKPETTDSERDIFAFMGETLAGKVKEVRASARLKTHPVMLVAGGEVSIEMEKVLRQMPAGGPGVPQADKLLEVNTGHTMFKALETAFAQDKERLGKYAQILYNQALLIEGLPIEDPVGYCNDVCELMNN